jgi:signal transduction histidine kinase/phage shock protein PspC (stress-responsive transcriptional regulator)
MAATASPPALQRDPHDRVLGGVCSAIGRRLGIDPLVVRVAFVAGTAIGGFGIPLYILGWVLIPGRDGEGRRFSLPGGRGTAEVSIGVALLVLAALLAVRASGVAWFSDAVTWPIVLVVTGGVLIWRSSQATAPGAGAETTPGASAAEAEAEERERFAWLASNVSRTGVGVALVVLAGLVFLQATGALSAARDVALGAIVVAVALGVIFAPFVLRLVRSLTAERAERIRSQERAEVAAHLHDSVLQTLALVQKRADDPRAVAALARRQERELRNWLFDRTQGEPGTVRAALEAAAAEVEEAHGAEVDVVAVGDRDLDERTAALVAAAREAMVNAAKHGGGSVSVYAEAGDGRTTVFVRDRGGGFEPAAVPADRRGIAESIVGRMERHGGRAAIHSAPGEGTEVELTL